jgi:CheY-like chemotaxis protein
MHETILIVDDDHAIARLASLWVSAAQYRVVNAYDGESGLAAAAEHHPHLILLDIRMPDLDGFEVHRRLKGTPDLSRIPVIFISAHVQEAARRQAIAAGARFFLSKPYEPKELLGTVRAALGGDGTETAGGGAATHSTSSSWTTNRRDPETSIQSSHTDKELTP